MKGNEAAFPLKVIERVYENGLTVRDYIAIAAMQALAAINEQDPEKAARLAYAHADAMIAQSER
jgi:hypothetical protein